jgi:lysosomal alpha-mannosidase
MLAIFFFILPLAVESETVTVHLVPHSHDDLGWLFSEDSYYYGCNGYRAHGVDTIISNIVSSLLLNPKRRAIYAEVGFLKMWWDEQDEEAHKLVRDLVRSGRLEIVNGGWSMPDEACPHYNELINDFVAGHEFLTKEIGSLPRTAYQIDPFGHSAEFANLAIQLGYSNLVINRIHHKDLENRRSKKDMEFFWSPYNNTNRIFTHILYDHYNSPKDMNFDDGILGSMAEPFVDKEDSSCYSAKYYQDIFLKRVESWRNSYKTSHVMMTFGNDFTLALGHRVFNNLDRLIKHFDNNPNLGLKVKYSTISEYLAEVRRENKNWSTKTGDFFPYADGEHAYWTGYFTTRPWLKENIVKTGRYLRNIDKMLAMKYATRTSEVTRSSIKAAIDNLRNLREYLGIVTHHDAISGTCTQKVAVSYMERLQQAKRKLDEIVSNLISRESETPFVSCDASFNETSCKYPESFSLKSYPLVISIFNPSSSSQTKIIELPINSKNITISDILGTRVNFNMISNDNFTPSPNLKYKVIFPAFLSPLAFTYYIISSSSIISSEISYTNKQTGKLRNQRFSLNYFYNQFSLTDLYKKSNIHFNLSLEYYTPIHARKDTIQRSGQYIFLPESENTTVISPCTSYRLITTDFFSRLKFKCGNIVQVSVSLYKLSNNVYPEVEYYIDGNQVSRKQMEIIIRYHTDVYHGDEFYTDSNSLGYLKRKWSHYDGVNIDIKEEVPFNYYPVTGYLAIQSNSTGMWLGIVPDRSQGGTVMNKKPENSLKGAEIELMIYRQTNSYDNKGIPEPYLETINGSTVSIVTKHMIVPEDSLDKVRVASFKRENQPQIFFSYTFNTNSIRSIANSVDLTSCGNLNNYIIHLRLKTPEIFILRVQQLVNSGLFPIRCYIRSILPDSLNFDIVQLNLDESESYNKMTSRTEAWEKLVQSSEDISLIPGDSSLGISWDDKYSDSHVTFVDFAIKTFAFKLSRKLEYSIEIS